MNGNSEKAETLLNRFVPNTLTRIQHDDIE